MKNYLTFLFLSTFLITGASYAISNNNWGNGEFSGGGAGGTFTIKPNEKRNTEQDKPTINQEDVEKNLINIQPNFVEALPNDNTTVAYIPITSSESDSSNETKDTTWGSGEFSGGGAGGTFTIKPNEKRNTEQDKPTINQEDVEKNLINIQPNFVEALPNDNTTVAYIPITSSESDSSNETKDTTWGSGEFSGGGAGGTFAPEGDNTKKKEETNKTIIIYDTTQTNIAQKADTEIDTKKQDTQKESSIKNLLCQNLLKNRKKNRHLK